MRSEIVVIKEDLRANFEKRVAYHIDSGFDIKYESFRLTYPSANVSNVSYFIIAIKKSIS